MTSDELLLMMRDAIDPLLFVAGDGTPPSDTFDDDIIEGAFTVYELRSAFAAVKAYAEFTAKTNKAIERDLPNYNLVEIEGNKPDEVIGVEVEY